MFWHVLWERFLSIFGIEINQRKEYQHHGLQISESIGIAIIDLTAKQKDEIGTIVAVTVPKVGEQIALEEELLIVKSRERVATFNSPVAGKVLATNPLIEKHPQELRYSSWIIKLRLPS